LHFLRRFVWVSGSINFFCKTFLHESLPEMKKPRNC
jgi:hypothetical protein